MRSLITAGQLDMRSRYSTHGLEQPSLAAVTQHLPAQAGLARSNRSSPWRKSPNNHLLASPSAHLL